MSSSVPGQGKVQSDLNASSTSKKADAEPVADSADSEDEFILYGDHLSDADPRGGVGNSLIEQSVSTTMRKHYAYQNTGHLSTAVQSRKRARNRIYFHLPLLHPAGMHRPPHNT
jgi:hypothetical protein